MRVVATLRADFYDRPLRDRVLADLLQDNVEIVPPLADYGGGSPTGGLVYMSDGLPEKYRNVPFFSEWGKGTVFAIDLDHEGATFKVKQNTTLISAPVTPAREKAKRRAARNGYRFAPPAPETYSVRPPIRRKRCIVCSCPLSTSVAWPRSAFQSGAMSGWSPWIVPAL